MLCYNMCLNDSQLQVAEINKKLVYKRYIHLIAMYNMIHGHKLQKSVTKQFVLVLSFSFYAVFSPFKTLASKGVDQ